MKPSAFYLTASRISLLLFVCTAWVCGCMAPTSIPLSQVYNRAAKSHIRNPVVLVHGLGGSLLRDKADGNVVWGAFSGIGINANSRQGIQKLALPVKAAKARDFGHEDISGLSDTIQASGPLHKIRLNVLGISMAVDVYRQILQTLGVGGFRDQTVAAGQIDYGTDHYTCFTFFYDWRKDIVTNARELDRFLKQTADYVAAEDARRGIRRKKVRFDLVAHSLGGLIARYYLRYGTEDVCLPDRVPEVAWKGAGRISRLIMIGPPNTGSVKTLEALLEGHKISWILPKFQPALISTFPSFYQLLPRPRHRIFLDEKKERKSLDLYDVNLWMENQWGIFSDSQEPYLRYLLPGADAPEKIAAKYVGAALERARRMHAALDQKPRTACPSEIYLFTSKSIPTEQLVGLSRRSGRLQMDFRGFDLKAPGDGTVTAANAMGDERQGRPWRPWVRTAIPLESVYLIQGDHLAITKSPRFTDNLLHLLLEMPPPEGPENILAPAGNDLF